VAGPCAHGNENSGSIKMWGISRLVEEVLAFQKDSAPRKWLVILKGTGIRTSSE
jgi:hypothetical protein